MGAKSYISVVNLSDTDSEETNAKRKALSQAGLGLRDLDKIKKIESEISKQTLVNRRNSKDFPLSPHLQRSQSFHKRQVRHNSSLKEPEVKEVLPVFKTLQDDSGNNSVIAKPRQYQVE